MGGASEAHRGSQRAGQADPQGDHFQELDLAGRVPKLSALNAITRGWAEYYRHTSLVSDIEEITRYVWFRYLQWLLRKHKGSRKHQLVESRTEVIAGRTRWTAEIREGDKVLPAYQWLPTRVELRRERYRLKGRGGFPHPYLTGIAQAEDYPIGEMGPAEHIYTDRIGASSGRSGGDEPLDIRERMLRAKMRDGSRCTGCGRRHPTEDAPHQGQEVARAGGPHHALPALPPGRARHTTDNDSMESRMCRKAQVRFGGGRRKSADSGSIPGRLRRAGRLSADG